MDREAVAGMDGHLADLEVLVALASWVRQDGGRAAHFTVRNRCNLPRLAHQLAMPTIIAVIPGRLSVTHPGSPILTVTR